MGRQKRERVGFSMVRGTLGGIAVEKKKYHEKGSGETVFASVRGKRCPDI